MPSWITLTADDLNGYLVAAQMNALRTAALAVSQDDPLPATIQDVCDSIRLEISGCRTNILSATAHAIPPELKRHACALIIEAAQGRLPSLKLTDDQKRAADNARALLVRIARCDVPVSHSTDPESTPDAQASARISVVRKGRTRATSRSLDRL